MIGTHDGLVVPIERPRCIISARIVVLVFIALLVLPLGAAFAAEPASSIDVLADEPQFGALCSAVARRLQTAPDPFAMIKNGTITDGHDFTRPVWRDADPRENLNIVRADFVGQHDPLNLKKKAEIDSLWRAKKDQTIQNILSGHEKLEVAQTRLVVNDAPAQAEIYRFTQFEKKSGEATWHAYVVHAVEGLDVRDLPVVWRASDLDLVLFKQEGFFFYVPDEEREFEVYSLVIGDIHSPGKLAITRACYTN